MKNQNLALFITLCFLSCLLIVIFNWSIDTNTLFYNSYASQVTQEQIAEFLEAKEKWSWTSYPFTICLLLLKTSLISLILQAGLYLSSVDISYKRLFNIVLKCEYIFLLPTLVKIIWFGVLVEPNSIQDVQSFYPFSLANLINTETLQPWLRYPLEVVNFFEIVYWFILIHLISIEMKDFKTWRPFKIVSGSYGTSLLIWILFIMFATLNMS